jgi:hypothetical protein
MSRYDSYVLRVWRRAHAPAGQWVARLDHIQGHESHSFHDRDALIAHLIAALADEEPGEGVEVKLGEKDRDDSSPEAGKSVHMADNSPEGSAESGRNIHDH